MIFMRVNIELIAIQLVLILFLYINLAWAHFINLSNERHIKRNNNDIIINEIHSEKKEDLKTKSKIIFKSERIPIKYLPHKKAKSRSINDIILEYNPNDDGLVASEEDIIYSSENIPIKFWTNEEKEELQDEVEDNIYISSVSSSSDFSFYNQLNSNEKQYYDIIQSKSKKAKPEFNIKVSVTDNSGKDLNSFVEELKESSERLFTVLVYENPELWWLGTYQIKLSRSDNKYLITFITIPETSMFSEYTTNDIVKINNEIETAKNIIMKKISDLKLTTNYAIIRFIHDYLIAKVVYTLDESRLHIRTLYGTLVENKSVCEGYAEAFQYIAQQYGINCIIARSSTHEWNFVEMNGKWYALDLTFDDPNGNKIPSNVYTNLETEYFLIGTEHICYKKKYSDDSDHILVYSGYSSNQIISYPYIEEEDYIPTDLELDEIGLINLSNILSFSSSATSTLTISTSITSTSITSTSITSTLATSTSTTLTTTTTKTSTASTLETITTITTSIKTVFTTIEKTLTTTTTYPTTETIKSSVSNNNENTLINISTDKESKEINKTLTHSPTLFENEDPQYNSSNNDITVNAGLSINKTNSAILYNLLIISVTLYFLI
ncbi:hypothetical protein H8356DRAFT_1312384 [Neocallimastix lanati (nom. inval.)]|nr:hypothetical protein H8356DRAFT_1312384 [Neocallimastix sp. JGI-2020a]